MQYQQISVRPPQTVQTNPVQTNIGCQNLAAGLGAGTIILTLKGEMAVEHLRPGDRIITRDSGVAVLRQVRKTRQTVCPIMIRAGSLGHTRPDADLILPPGTSVHIRDWRAKALYGQPTANVPAQRLVDGEFVIALPKQDMTTFQLLFDMPHILYASGLEVVSA